MMPAESDFDFLVNWLLEVSEVVALIVRLEWSQPTVWLWKANFIGNISVHSMLGCGLGRKRWVAAFNEVVSLADFFLFLVTLLVSHHLQIFDFCFWGWR